MAVESFFAEKFCSDVFCGNFFFLRDARNITVHEKKESSSKIIIIINLRSAIPPFSFAFINYISCPIMFSCSREIALTRCFGGHSNDVLTMFCNSMFHSVGNSRWFFT